MRVRMEGIKMRRMPVREMRPLKEFFHLELTNTLKILSHFRDHNDLEEGFDLYLPKRMVKSERDLEDEDQEIIQKMLYKHKLRDQSRTKVYQPIED